MVEPQTWPDLSTVRFLQKSSAGGLQAEDIHELSTGLFLRSGLPVAVDTAHDGVAKHSMNSNTLLIIIVLVLLFGGGGFYFRGRR